ncbi:MAG TPA: hypothetical protein DCM87_16185 [Planctomycetes bacterium]|nr:hypothetical protein [Planctomycetota bacterium]
MAVVPAIGFFELILIPLLGLGGIILPGGVPPLPEDPALIRAVPADAILAVQWFGGTEPNPQSANATERLAANPEIKALVGTVIEAFHKTARMEAPPEIAQGVKSGLDILGLLAARPGCLYVSRLDLPPAQPNIAAGIIVNAGDKAAEAGRLLREIENLVLAQMSDGGRRPAAATSDVNGVPFRSLPLPPPVPPVAWGFSGEYLIVAAGDGTPARMLEALKAPKGLGATAAFAKMHAAVKTPAPVSRFYLNVEAVLAKITAMGGPEAAGALNALGLTSIQAVVAETGLEGAGVASKTLVAVKGVPSGLLRLCEGAPLADSDLALIPGDATIAAAFRLDAETIYNEFLTSLGTFDPRARDEFLREVPHGLERELGLSVTDDILRPLGDTWCLWSAPSDGGLLFTGLTLAVTVKDRERFQKTLDKIAGLMRREMGEPRGTGDRRPRRGLFLESTTCRGVAIQYLNSIGEEFPVAPAWCLTDTHFSISLFPQMLKTALARGAAVESSLARQTALKDRGGALALTYADTPSIFRMLYPLAHPLAQILCGKLQREGIDVTIASLPTAAGILPHLGPEVSTVARTDQGVLMITRGTVPSAGPVLGLMLPAMTVLGFRTVHAPVQQPTPLRAMGAHAR